MDVKNVLMHEWSIGMERSEGEYQFSDNQELLSLETICGFLKRSYWAADRSETTIKESISHSLCYGVYHQGRQIGFARVVTDHSVMYWLCDVFIDEAYRGLGLGKKLIAFIVESDELKGLTGILGTKDAHELYEQFGFERDPVRFMRKKAGESNQFNR
jgi:GNAT superfamily N-acetyltransferase